MKRAWMFLTVVMGGALVGCGDDSSDTGGSAGAALLHVARTTVRRAERTTWLAVHEHGPSMNALPAQYLNRLSDLLFILCRYANRENGDVLWVPGGERQR